MKRNIALIVCVVLAILVITYRPSDKPSDNPGAQLPKGVYSHGTEQYYKVRLPGGTAALSLYFDLQGKSGTVVVGQTDAKTYSKDMGTVHYSQVAQGGWVAYEKNGSGCVLVIPETVSQKDVKLISSRLLWDSENYMSVEEAREYIPWL